MITRKDQEEGRQTIAPRGLIGRSGALQCAWQCGVCPGVPDTVPHLCVALCPICDGKLIWRKNGRLETRKITFVAFVNLVICQQRISWYFHDKMCDLCRIGLLICICFPVAIRGRSRCQLLRFWGHFFYFIAWPIWPKWLNISEIKVWEFLLVMHR